MTRREKRYRKAIGEWGQLILESMRLQDELDANARKTWKRLIEIAQERSREKRP
jgi:hypothetical protein